MALPVLTYTIANNDTTDATKAMQNWNDCINAMTDGTKSFTIDALTTGGNVVLGTASKTVTFNGTLITNILFGTTWSYSFGSATNGLKYLYLGSADGAARTTNVTGATVASSWTLTTPTGVPSVAGYVLAATAAGVSSWEDRNKLATVAKTTTYTATSADEFISCSTAGGAWTLTLPASVAGKIFVVKKTTDDFTVLTIDGNAAETIDGALTTTIDTRYEQVTLLGDGSNWHITSRTYPGIINAYTPTTQGLGTVATVDFYWKREGQGVRIFGGLTLGTVTAAEARISLPTGLTATAHSYANSCGSVAHAATVAYPYNVLIGGSGTNLTFSRSDGTLNPQQPQNGSALFGSSVALTVNAWVPILGWK